MTPDGNEVLSPRTPWGDRLLQMVMAAEEEILLVSPFITREPVRRVLGNCPHGVSLTVVGRFLPEDVAAGVSELEAVELLLSDGRLNTKVLLNPSLHGKLYRADGNCLVGSANLTLKGLGWSSNNNLELLIPLDYTMAIRSFEQLLLTDAITMTGTLSREIHARAKELIRSGDVSRFPAERVKEETWLPSCMNPASLYEVYADHNTHQILQSVIDAAQRDLEQIGPIPKNLDRQTFERWISHSFREHPLVSWLQEEDEVTSEDGIAKIRGLGTSGHRCPLTPELSWEIFQEWVLYFLGDQFRAVPTAFKILHGRRF